MTQREGFPAEQLACGRVLRGQEAVFAQAPTPFAMLGFPSFAVSAVNSAMQKLMGLSSAAACCAHLQKELTDADAMASGEGGRLKRLMESAWEAPSAAEAFIMGADGNPVLCELVFAGLKSAEFPGEDGTILLFINDIRPLHTLMGMLQKGNDQLADIMDSAPMPAMAVTDGRVLDCNLAAGRLFGLSAGQNVAEIFLNGQEYTNICERLGQEGTLENYPVLLHGADNQEHTCTLFIRKLLYQGQPAEVIWCLDKTRQSETEGDLKKAMLRADEAARARSDFLAHMSHELRTPMNGILGMSYLCLQTDLEPHQRNYLQKIQSSAYTLLSDINDILDFSQIERGQLLLLREPFTLQDVVGSLYARFEPQAREKGVELHLATAPDLTMPLLGDSARITQTLGHLLGNALKFTDAGEINFAISLLQESEHWSRWSFTVKDTGMGMDPSLVTSLLLPFTQADASMTRRFGGIGLGLTLTHRVLELMGGKLSVESTLGGGSSFYISLPLEKATCPAEATACALPPPANPMAPKPLPKVLLVEDSEINQEIATALLRGTGVEVDVANNGREALDMVTRNSYQLVFMDIQMPEMDGLEAAQRIRAQGEMVPIVAMTAHAQPEDRAKSLAAGMNDHLTKPLKPDQLLRVLHSLVPSSVPSRVETPPSPQPETVSGGNFADCLNTSQGLETVGGNMDLYHKLLRKFLDGYAAVDIELARARELHDEPLARRLAHTVKNVAASLGMQPLSLAMIAVENRLKQECEPQELREALSGLHEQLAVAQQAVRDYLATGKTYLAHEQALLGTGDAALALELLDGLPELLEQDVGQAIERMARLTFLLENSAQASLLEALAREVENFDVNRTRLAILPLSQTLRSCV